MAEKVRPYPLAILSGASETASAIINNSTRVSLYIGDKSSWDAGSGNSEFALYGSYASGVTHVPIESASALTAGSGIFPLTGGAGIPNVSIKLGTAATSTGTVYLIVSEDS